MAQALLTCAATRSRRMAAVLAVALVWLPAAAAAQTADDLFDGSRLHSVEITIHSRDWDDLRVNVFDNTDYPCDVTWNGVRVRNVGVRSRGSGSRFGPKPGLRLAFDHYAARQRFLGLQELVLDNLVTDPSMLRESVAMALMRRAGVAAPREAPARVFVNGQFAGLFMMVEAVDPVFAERAFGAPAGLLYEYRWTSPFFATYPGDDLDAYKTLFESRNDGLHSTVELYSPIRELFKAINEIPSETYDLLDRYLDLNGFIRTIAMASFMAEWDGFLGYDGMNNFYLYQMGEQAQLIPWDRDHAFHAPDYPILAGAAENTLMRKLLEHPGLRATFFGTLSGAMATATDNGWLEKEIQRQYALVREAAWADPVKPFTNEAFDQAVADLVLFARTRPAFVQGEIARLR